jgi:DNA-binding XRE family transcriptional regulator/DNA-directed RNA polymerase subunit RPC12/RpoP
MNRFRCNKYGRILNKDRDFDFKCSVCGYGTMEPIKPKAFCCRCGQPIYDNVDTDASVPWHNTDGSVSKQDQETEGIDVICPDCTSKSLMSFKQEKIKDKENKPREARIQRGLSQLTLAACLGISQQYLCQMESGDKPLNEVALNFIEKGGLGLE